MPIHRIRLSLEGWLTRANVLLGHPGTWLVSSCVVMCFYTFGYMWSNGGVVLGDPLTDLEFFVFKLGYVPNGVLYIVAILFGIFAAPLFEKFIFIMACGAHITLWLLPFTVFLLNFGVTTATSYLGCATLPAIGVYLSFREMNVKKDLESRPRSCVTTP